MQQKEVSAMRTIHLPHPHMTMHMPHPAHWMHEHQVAIAWLAAGVLLLVILGMVVVSYHFGMPAGAGNGSLMHPQYPSYPYYQYY